MWPIGMVGSAAGDQMRWLAVPRSWRKSLVLGLAALVAGALAGFLSVQRDRAVMAAEVPDGPNSVLVVVATDARSSRFGGSWFLARPSSPCDPGVG